MWVLTPALLLGSWGGFGQVTSCPWDSASWGIKMCQDHSHRDVRRIKQDGNEAHRAMPGPYKWPQSRKLLLLLLFIMLFFFN